MLATAATLNGRDVIVAIIGGTMLTLALTRPQLKWVEQLTKDSDSARLWADRALTFFLLTMAGYAASTVALALYKQIGHEIAALIEVAGAFLFVYTWLVHFEPFVREWRLRGGAGAAVLYTCIMLAAAVVGYFFASLALGEAAPWLIAAAIVLVALGWSGYRWGPVYPPMNDSHATVEQPNPPHGNETA